MEHLNSFENTLTEHFPSTKNETFYATTHIDHTNTTNIDITEFESSTVTVNDIPENLSSEGLENWKIFGYRNIREIKELVFDQLLKRGHLKIRELEIPLSPAGILIIFLHLVNEKHLSIRSV